jgi:hypothetical protein
MKTSTSTNEDFLYRETETPHSTKVPRLWKAQMEKNR